MQEPWSAVAPRCSRSARPAAGARPGRCCCIVHARGPRAAARAASADPHALHGLSPVGPEREGSAGKDP